MKIPIALLCLLFGTSAMAATAAYDLKLELSIDGKTVATSRIVTKRGETATITQQDQNGNGYTIEVLADEGVIEKSKGILMKFKVSRVVVNGTTTLLAAPQILTAKENEKATVSVGNEKEKGLLGLSVIAQRKNL